MRQICLQVHDTHLKIRSACVALTKPIREGVQQYEVGVRLLLEHRRPWKAVIIAEFHTVCDRGGTQFATLARSTYLTSDQLLLVMLPHIQQRLFVLLFVKTLTSPTLAQEGLRKPDDRAGRQIHFNFPILNRLFGRGHNDDDEQEDSDRWTQGFRRMKGFCSSSGPTPQLQQNELELWKTKRMR